MLVVLFGADVTCAVPHCPRHPSPPPRHSPPPSLSLSLSLPLSPSPFSRSLCPPSIDQAWNEQVSLDVLDIEHRGAEIPPVDRELGEYLVGRTADSKTFYQNEDGSTMVEGFVAGARARHGNALCSIWSSSHALVAAAIINHPSFPPSLPVPCAL